MGSITSVLPVYVLIPCSVTRWLFFYIITRCEGGACQHMTSRSHTPTDGWSVWGGYLWLPGCQVQILPGANTHQKVDTLTPHISKSDFTINHGNPYKLLSKPVPHNIKIHIFALKFQPLRPSHSREVLDKGLNKGIWQPCLISRYVGIFCGCSFVLLLVCCVSIFFVCDCNKCSLMVDKIASFLVRTANLHDCNIIILGAQTANGLTN